MDSRRQGTGQDDRSGREQQRDDYGQGQRALTEERQGTDTERWGGSGSSGGSGDWQGYVVPYRYYGQGYQGVGYYSVMYQGPGREESGGQGRWNEGQGRWSEGEGQGRWNQGQGRQSMSGGRQGQGQGGYGQGGFGQGFGQGGYAGLGPKGYRRSDERLREDVSDRLMEDDALDASGIEVQVRDGEVTLTGTVPDRSMKRRAEDCAERVMGVREVMNQIRLGNEGTESSGSWSGGETGTQTGQTGQTSQTSRKGQSTGSTQHNGQREKASTSTR